MRDNVVHIGMRVIAIPECYNFFSFKMLAYFGIRIIHITKNTCIARACTTTCRRNSLRDILSAERAFLHDSFRAMGCIDQMLPIVIIMWVAILIGSVVEANHLSRLTPIELAHTIRAGACASTASNATVIINQNRAGIFINVGSSSGAYLFARGVRAMLAADRNKLHTQLIIYLNRNIILRSATGKRSVPPDALRLRVVVFANNRAGSTSNTAAQVNRHCVSHDLRLLSIFDA